MEDGGWRVEGGGCCLALAPSLALSRKVPGLTGCTFYDDAQGFLEHNDRQRLQWGLDMGAYAHPRNGAFP